MDAEKHKYQLQQWSGLIQERINSGKTIKRWCAENGICKSRYYYWLDQIQKESSDRSVENPDASDAPKTIAVTPGSSQPEMTANSMEVNTFVELHTSGGRTSFIESSGEPHPSAMIRTCGIEIALYADTPESFLRRLVQVLRDA